MCACTMQNGLGRQDSEPNLVNFFLPKYAAARTSFESNWDHELSPFFVMEIQDIVIMKLYER